MAKSVKKAAVKKAAKAAPKKAVKAAPKKAVEKKDVIKKATAKKAATKKIEEPKKVIKASLKKAAVKAAPKKVEPKKAAAKKAAKEQGGFMAALNPSPALAAVIGNKPLPRTEIIKQVWVYIKKHKLQDKENKRMINADEKLLVLFAKKKQVSMFDLAKIISNHVS